MSRGLREFVCVGERVLNECRMISTENNITCFYNTHFSGWKKRKNVNRIKIPSPKKKSTAKHHASNVSHAQQTPVTHRSLPPAAAAAPDTTPRAPSSIVTYRVAPCHAHSFDSFLFFLFGFVLNGSLPDVVDDEKSPAQASRARHPPAVKRPDATLRIHLAPRDSQS